MRNKSAAIIAALITVASMAAIPASATDSSLQDSDITITVNDTTYTLSGADSGDTTNDPTEATTDNVPAATDNTQSETDSQTETSTESQTDPQPTDDTTVTNPKPTDSTDSNPGTEQQDPTAEEPATYSVNLNHAYTGGGQFVKTDIRVVIYDSLNTGRVLVNKTLSTKDPCIEWTSAFPMNDECRYLMKTYAMDGSFIDNYNFFAMDGTFSFTERRIPESATLVSNFDLIPYDVADGSLVTVNVITNTDVGKTISSATITSSSRMINISMLNRNQAYALLVHDADGYITDCYTISIAASGKLTVKNGIDVSSANTSPTTNSGTSTASSSDLVIIDDIVSEKLTTEGVIVIKDAKKRIVETANITATDRQIDLSPVKSGGEYTMYIYDLAETLGYAYRLTYDAKEDMIYITKTYDFTQNTSSNNTNTSDTGKVTNTQYTSTANKPSSYTTQNTSNTSSGSNSSNGNTANTSSGTKTSQTNTGNTSNGTKTSQANSGSSSSSSGQPNTGNASSGSGQVTNDARNPDTGDDTQPEPTKSSHAPLYATLASSFATVMLFLTRKKIGQ